MSIKILTDIQPGDPKDTYALMDAKYLKGGFLVVDTTADITSDSAERKVDRLYFVKADSKFYKWDVAQATYVPVSLTGTGHDIVHVTGATEISIPVKDIVIAEYTPNTLSSFDQTLPDMSTGVDGARLYFINNAARTTFEVTLKPAAGQTIRGGTSRALPGKGATIELVADKANNNWVIVNEYEPSIQHILDDAGSLFPVESIVQFKGSTIVKNPDDQLIVTIPTGASSTDKVVAYAPTSPVTFDATATDIVAKFKGLAEIVQVLPALSSVSEGTRYYIENLSPADKTLTLTPAGTDKIKGTTTYAVDTNNAVELIADVDAANWQVTLEQDKSSSTGAVGITLDDGTTNRADVRTLNLKGASITKVPTFDDDDPHEVTVTAGPSVHMMAPNQQYGLGIANEFIVEPPLNVFDDPDSSNDYAVRFGVKHDAFEPMHKPSYLAYIKDNEEVIGKLQINGTNTVESHHDGAIWFDDTVWPAGAYIETDRANKKFGIQEADTLDPNVTGGTDYLVAFRAHLKGTAPSDGFVRIYLYNASIDPFNPTGYLLDKQGNPMVVQRNYKADEELGTLDLLGIVNAKGLQEFTCHVVDTFTNDVIMLTDRTEGATGLMIQALTSESKTGMGLQQFELDTNQNIEFSSHYLGVDRMNLGFINSRAETPVSYTAGTNFTTVDGWRLINPNGIKVGVVDGHTHIQDDGVHICEFNYGKVFSSEETQMLRGKDIEVTTTLVDKNAGFEVALMKWTGTPDDYTKEIFTTRTNTAPNFQTNWVKASSFFISEDVVAGAHTLSHTFTVPSDANNYAMIIYPTVAQQPITLKLKEFKVDVNPAFIGYVLHAPELTNELHLYFDKEYKKFVQDVQGYASLRYTINNTPSGLPMPAGEPKKGAADITLDTSIHQITGSAARGGEGALKFNEDGDATISTQLLVWSEKSSNVVAQTKFWWSTVSPDGSTFTKIPESELTVGVRGGTKAINMMPTFKLQVEKDDRIALFASSDQADGAFLESVSSNAPMVSTTINFEELVPVGSGDDPDLISAPYDRKLVVDRRVVPFTNIASSNYTFALDIPADVEIGAHSVVGVVGDKIVSLDESQFSYDTTNNEMTVHVGSVTTGKIYLTFWG